MCRKINKQQFFKIFEGFSGYVVVCFKGLHNLERLFDKLSISSFIFLSYSIFNLWKHISYVVCVNVLIIIYIFQWCCKDWKTRSRGTEKPAYYPHKFWQEPVKSDRGTDTKATFYFRGEYPGQWGTYQYPSRVKGQLFIHLLTMDSLLVSCDLTFLFGTVDNFRCYQN